MYPAQGSKREVFKFLYGFDENWQKPESLTLRFQKKVSIMGLDPSRGLPWPGEGLERIDHARSGGAWGVECRWPSARNARAVHGWWV